jgi:succinate dehydrogenase / fumarate reductase membrane anchor subunit
MGLRIWLWQRFTALYLVIYGIILSSYMTSLKQYDYEHWHTLWSSPFLSAATIIVLCSIALHATLGLWFILSDYLKVPLLRSSILLVYVSCFTAIIANFILVLGGVR